MLSDFKPMASNTPKRSLEFDPTPGSGKSSKRKRWDTSVITNPANKQRKDDSYFAIIFPKCTQVNSVVNNKEEVRCLSQPETNNTTQVNTICSSNLPSHNTPMEICECEPLFTSSILPTTSFSLRSI